VVVRHSRRRRSRVAEFRIAIDVWLHFWIAVCLISAKKRRISD
jgi:hypothetical protein